MLLDGRSVDACLVLAVEADGAEVVTVEGLAAGGRARRRSSRRSSTPAPSSAGSASRASSMSRAGAARRRTRTRRGAEIEEGLAGNLCRCACYEQIFEAVERVASGAARATSPRPPRDRRAGADVGARSVEEGLDQ